ncbi:hypothetical protein BDEG_27455 [Batrachochytrium dendrobatidis JEL423]|uniref:Uncharacterized protein n=1 Tax=Batrachochytrium dendrobatidis (strain JEL423) TaxID=403673 RepID=A0A177WXG1_BATDL|nr:hypothetical protein BDEG_27455 [Batrachochytrium dendrobatidis JEL423]
MYLSDSQAVPESIHLLPKTILPNQQALSHTPINRMRIRSIILFSLFSLFANAAVINPQPVDEPDSTLEKRMVNDAGSHLEKRWYTQWNYKYKYKHHGHHGHHGSRPYWNGYQYVNYYGHNNGHHNGHHNGHYNGQWYRR